MSAGRSAGVVAAALLALAGSPAQARELWSSADGESALELRAFYKTIGAGLVLQPGLVDGTGALRSVIAEATGAEAGAAVPPYGGTSSHAARVWGRLLFLERLELSAGWQLAGTVASDPALIGAGGLGGSAAGASTSAGATRRLVDFDNVLAERDGLLLQHNLDLLALKYSLPSGELVVGRQVLSWGTGRFWNPTDLLSPFSPTDVDREVRHGVDAVRYSVPLGTTTLVDVLWLPQQEGWAQGGVLRGQTNLAGFDFSLSAAKYQADLVYGADSSGDVGPVGVHAELAYTLGLANLEGGGPVEIEERFLRAVAGLELRPAEEWVVGAEYYFNGFGAEDPEGYAARLRSDRLARGEVFGAGRHYVGLSAAWLASELLTLQTLLVSNVADPSAQLVPVLEYWAEQSVIVRAGGYVPIGARPDAGALQGLTVADVLDESPAFTDATSSLGLRSEYGSSPWGLFAQVGVYF